MAACPVIDRNDQISMKFPDGTEMHLGYSRLSKYFQCPAQYKFTYVDKIRTEGGLPLRRGQAYHGSVEELLNFKLAHGDLMCRDKADRVAIRCAKAENLTDTEVYRVIDAVRFYHQEMYPSHQPLAVEKEFSLVRGGVTLTGRIDLIETHGMIVDHKFSYDTWADSRARYGCQPMIYQWAGIDVYEKEFPGWEYKGFAYNIIKLYPHPVIQTIAIDRLDQRSSDWWEEQLYQAALAIRRGYFPAIPSDKNCQFCEHKKLCNPVIYKLRKGAVGGVLQDEEDI